MASSLHSRAFAVLMLLVPLLLPFASAQEPGGPPSVSVTCQFESNPASLDVSSTGSNFVTAMCTIENSSIFSEDISIEYDNDGLNVVGPTSLTLAASASIDIQVAIAGTEGMNPANKNVTVSAEVTSVGAVPIMDQIRPTDESNILVDIEAYSELSMEINPNFMKLDAGGLAQTVLVTVLNDGNAPDNVEISVGSADLIARGFFVEFPPPDFTIQKDGGVTFEVSITPPSELDTESIEVRVTATSTERLGSTSEVFTVNATAEPESILDFSAMNIPTWAWIAGGVLATLVVLAVIASLVKRMKSKSSAYLDEYDAVDDDDDDDFEFEDDDLDDLDDLDLEDF